MAKIAILGFGTVGSGVYEVLCRNAAGVSRRAGEPVEVKYILDPKDFSDHPAAKLFIKNFDAILEDPEVKVVVEIYHLQRFSNEKQIVEKAYQEYLEMRSNGLWSNWGKQHKYY